MNEHLKCTVFNLFSLPNHRFEFCGSIVDLGVNLFTTCQSGHKKRYRFINNTKPKRQKQEPQCRRRMKKTLWFLQDWFCNVLLFNVLLTLCYLRAGVVKQCWERGHHADITMVTGHWFDNKQLHCGHTSWGWLFRLLLCSHVFSLLSFTYSMLLPLSLSFLVTLTLAVIVAPKHTVLVLCHWLVTNHITGVSWSNSGQKGKLLSSGWMKKSAGL